MIIYRDTEGFAATRWSSERVSARRGDARLFMAGSRLFVVLGRVRMKRERVTMPAAFEIPRCDPKETYEAPAVTNGL